MTKYDRLTGPGRGYNPGYIDPINGEFTTHVESDARVRVLKELGVTNFSTPESRRVAQDASIGFMDKARGAIAKRNKPTK